MKKINPLFLLPVLILTSCSSSLPILHLSPVANQGVETWYNGTPVREKLVNKQRVAVSFSYHNGRELHFDATIYNEDTIPIDIYPEQFTLEYLDSLGRTLISIPLIRPDSIFDKTRKELEKNSRAQGTSAIWGLVEGTVGLAGTIAGAVSNESPAKEKERQDNMDQINYNRDQRNNKLLDEEASLKEQLNRDMKTLLKNHTLYPNHWIAGDVGFEFLKGAAFYRLVILIRGEKFNFIYRAKPIN